MNFAQTLDVAVPLAAVMVPAFVLGFGAVWLAMNNGFGQIRVELAELRSEIGDLRKELHSLSERVQAVAERIARIEGQLDPRATVGAPPVPAGE